MRLLLIRHGQTPANVRGELDTGRPGPALTALGRAQAAAIPTALAGQQIDAIYASTLVRTQQTAAPLARKRGLRVTTLAGVHEIEAGDREMASDEDSYRVYLETCKAWGLGQRERMMPGATTGTAFFERFDASIAQVSASGAEVAAVVSHSAAMRVWIAGTARNIEPIFTARQELDNTSMVVLDGSAIEGWSLVSWHGQPLGGDLLADDAAEDPTGESIDEALT